METSSGPLRSPLGKDAPAVRKELSSNDSPTSEPSSGALAGDLEGLGNVERDGFESVLELSEEGQDLEAEQLDGIERALDPDQGELPSRDFSSEQKQNRFKDRNRM
jgi:hypothetical protein